MTRRPLVLIVAVLMAIAVASPVAAASKLPSRTICRRAGCPRASPPVPATRSMWARSPVAGSGARMSGPARRRSWSSHGAAPRPVWNTRSAHIDCWVAGGPTGTVRVYDARSGDLLRQYNFPGMVFLNDLVVTKDAVYVTDSFNPWLDVIPLGANDALPTQAEVTTLPLDGIVTSRTGSTRMASSLRAAR